MFRSDNTAPAHPAVAQAFATAMMRRWDDSAVYGQDLATQKLQSIIQTLTDRECFVRPVVTGTAANNLAIRTLTHGQGGRILCDPNSHMIRDEGMAPAEMARVMMTAVEFYPYYSEQGWTGLSSFMQSMGEVDRRHGAKPKGVVIAQADESGHIHSDQEIHKLCNVAHSHDLFAFIDGARFANAIAAGCEVKEQCANINGMTFGASKNGGGDFDCMVLFDESLADEFDRNAKSFGHSPAHVYNASSALLAYFQDDLWKKNAAHSNEMAALLRDALGQKTHPVDMTANMVFSTLTEDSLEALNRLGHHPYCWSGQNYRFVTDWQTSPEDIEEVAEIINKARLRQKVGREFIGMAHNLNVGCGLA